MLLKLLLNWEFWKLNLPEVLVFEPKIGWEDFNIVKQELAVLLGKHPHYGSFLLKYYRGRMSTEPEQTVLLVLEKLAVIDDCCQFILLEETNGEYSEWSGNDVRDASNWTSRVREVIDLSAIGS